MKSTDMEYRTAVARLFGEAIARGFDFPMYLVAVASNGSVIAERVESVEEFRTLTEHFEDDELQLPINLFAVDSKGRHCHAVIGSELVPGRISGQLY